MNELPIMREVFPDIPYCFAVYPGHPITIAYLITKIFKTYEEAFKQTSYGYSEALASNNIPGAGGNVSDALRLLHRLREKKSWEEVICWADNCWGYCDSQKAGGPERLKKEAGSPESGKEYYKNRWKVGQEQADVIKPLLKKQENWWAKC